MKQSPNYYDGWSWKLDWEETQISKGITTERKTSNIDKEDYVRSYNTSYYTDDNLTLMKKDLMQNCDLPPPLKLFVGPEKPAMAAMKTVSDQEDEHTRVGSAEQEKLGLLKALQLSQTRAREAERKVRLLSEERDHLSNSLLQESLRLFAHQQWLKVLEFELDMLCGLCIVSGHRFWWHRFWLQISLQGLHISSSQRTGFWCACCH